MLNRRVLQRVARHMKTTPLKTVSSRLLFSTWGRNSYQYSGEKVKNFGIGASILVAFGAVMASIDTYKSDTVEVYDPSEIIRHNTLDDCWIVVSNKIYDLTAFLKEFPAAESILMKYLGKDATSAFKKVKAVDGLLTEMSSGAVAGVMVKPFQNDEELEPISKEELQRLVYMVNRPELSEVFSVLDFEYIAKKIMDPVSYTYYSTGADDEFTVRENHYAYNRIFFKPRVLTDTEKVDLSSELLGTKVDVPIYITAFAGSKLAHPLGELNLSRAAYRENVMQMVPTQLSMPFTDFMEQIPQDQPQWAQLHFYSPEEIQNSIKHFKRFEAQKTIKGVFVNVDIAALGNREKDSKMRAKRDGELSMREFTNHEVPRPTLTWGDVERFKTETSLPLCLKGVQNLQDVVKAAELGMSAVIISNHGGRQLDFSQPSLEVLAESKALLKEKGLEDKIELYIDGGIKRGSDIIKLLCLGAKGVGLGRPFLYAMLGYGEAGAAKTISLLKLEIERDMKLLGVSRIEDLNEDLLDLRGFKIRSNGSDDRMYNNAYVPVYFPRFKNGQ